MAIYTNTITSTTASIALGVGTLLVGDTIRFNESGENYSQGLADLNTRITAIYFDPGYYGNVGLGASPMTAEANTMVLNSHSPNVVSLIGLGGTVGLMHIELLSNAAVWLKNYTLTKLRLISGGLVEIDGSTTVTSAYLGGEHASAVFRAGTIMTLLVLSEKGTKATLERDCTSVRINGGTVICNDATATPANVDVYDGSIQLLSGTVTIKAGQKAVVDLSKATGDFTITWEVYGNITIKRPPSGTTWNEPTDAEIFSGNVTVID